MGRLRGYVSWDPYIRHHHKESCTTFRDFPTSEMLLTVPVISQGLYYKCSSPEILGRYKALLILALVLFFPVSFAFRQWEYHYIILSSTQKYGYLANATKLLQGK